MTISINTLYDSIFIPGFIAAFIVMRLWLYKYQVSKLRTLIYNVLMIGFGYWGLLLGAYVYNWIHRLRDLPGNQRLTIFGSIITFVVAVFVAAWGEKLVRRFLREKLGRNVPDISVRETYDVIQPGAIVLLAEAKARCLWAGCCYGIPCAWGPYSSALGENAFPVQLTEILMSLTVMVLTYRFIHGKTYRRGAALFFTGGLWCFGRFFLEFLMYYPDYERTFFGYFTLFQCACVLIIAIFAAVITVLYKRYPAEPRSKKRPKKQKPEKKKD